MQTLKFLILLVPVALLAVKLFAGLLSSAAIATLEDFFSGVIGFVLFFGLVGVPIALGGIVWQILRWVNKLFFARPFRQWEENVLASVCAAVVAYAHLQYCMWVPYASQLAELVYKDFGWTGSWEAEPLLVLPVGFFLALFGYGVASFGRTPPLRSRRPL